MTGSTRLINSTASVRAPYSVPQTMTNTHLSPKRNFDPETGAPLRLLAPFVPREFRANERNDVTAMPAAARRDESDMSADAPRHIPASIAELFIDETQPVSDFASFIESHARDESETGDSTELPWIDAFAADVPTPEENWPLDEAGKRLDELTQSLTSLDAARERIEAERMSAEAAVPEVPVQMWNEEEWIDIMPTLPADIVSQGERPLGVIDNELAKSDALANGSMSAPVNVESAARALEGLALRVRSGQVQVPAFSAELGQEAMLAGLLASMLGWRQ